MSISNAGRLAVLAALAAPALVLGALTVSAAHAQDGGTDDLLIKATVSVESASKGDEDIMVTVTAENAENLAAFGFQLTYDPDIIEVVVSPETQQPLIQRGDFLGSTGREVACPDPQSQPGVLRVQCVTLRLEPPGADGAGTLTTVTFRAIGSGTTELTLDNLEANEPDATEIRPIQVQSASLRIKGGGSTNWALWGGIAAVVAAVVVGGGGFAALRMRGASSTGASAPGQ